MVRHLKSVYKTYTESAATGGCHQRRDNRHGDSPKKGLSKYTYCQRVVAYAQTSINQKPLWFYLVGECSFIFEFCKFFKDTEGSIQMFTTYTVPLWDL